MNILIATELDNGNQMYALCCALNKYTSHSARLITFKESYLDYKTDVLDPSLNMVESLVDTSDFFILGEILHPRMHTDPIFHKLNVNNSIIRAGGSLARNRPELYNQGKLRTIIKTGGYHDWTIQSGMSVMGNTVNICHFDEWPEKVIRDPGKPVRLVFSGTALKKKKEHSGAYMEAWEKLSKIYSKDKVEFVTIAGLSWKESLKLKATCDICYDQLKIGIYANSAIEGMYYSMPTFCVISGWCKSIFPDVPVIPYTSVDDIINATITMIEHPKTMQQIGDAGHRYVMQVHTAEEAVKRWENLIEFVTQLRC